MEQLSDLLSLEVKKNFPKQAEDNVVNNEDSLAEANENFLAMFTEFLSLSNQATKTLPLETKSTNVTHNQNTANDVEKIENNDIQQLRIKLIEGNISKEEFHHLVESLSLSTKEVALLTHWLNYKNSESTTEFKHESSLNSPLESSNEKTFKESPSISLIKEQKENHAKLNPNKVDILSQQFSSEKPDTNKPVMHHSNFKMSQNVNDLIQSQQQNTTPKPIQAPSSSNVQNSKPHFAKEPSIELIQAILGKNANDFASIKQQIPTVSSLIEANISQHNLSSQSEALVERAPINTGSQTMKNEFAQLTPLQSLSPPQREFIHEALTERIHLMLSKNVQRANIQLDPPELGRLQINLKLNQDSATVQFTVTNHAIKEVIEQSMPRLREMFLQQGISLSQSSVQQDNPGEQSFFQQQNKQNQAEYKATNWQTESVEDKEINTELNLFSQKKGIDYYA